MRRLEMSLRLPTSGVEGSKYDDSSNPHDDSTPGGSYNAQASVP
jgi:hypothetical protein